MDEVSNIQSDRSGLKRQSMVSASALVEMLGPWANGADPLNEQLADALTRAIEVGLLPPGTRLPAVKTGWLGCGCGAGRRRPCRYTWANGCSRAE